MNPEALIGNRGGLHAFQAVPSRANYEREFPFHPSMRSHLSVSPKNVHPTTGKFTSFRLRSHYVVAHVLFKIEALN